MKVLSFAVFAILALGVPTKGNAQVVAYTSFEEPYVVPGQYVDTLPWSYDHALPNHTGEPILNYDPQSVTAFELGFASYYMNTMADEGLTDGDYVGVTNDTGAVGSFPDGSNGFQMSDTEGQMLIAFDAVDLSGTESPRVRVRLFVTATDYEGYELVHIWVGTGGQGNVDVFFTQGLDIDDLGIEGVWITAEAALPSVTEAKLFVAFESDEDDEALYVDHIEFIDIAIFADGFETADTSAWSP